MLGNALGVRWQEASVRTEDIDLALDEQPAEGEEDAQVEGPGEDALIDLEVQAVDAEIEERFGLFKRLTHFEAL